MKVRLLILGALLALGAASAAATLPDGAFGGRGAARAGFAAPRGVARTPIQHVVFLMKENRSFDQYFGAFPGADGATVGTMSDGTVVPLLPTPEPLPQDISHQVSDWRVAYDGGRMDGFDREAGAIVYDGVNIAYTQLGRVQIPNYWAYASRFALGDHMFAPSKGPSFGNNLSAVAAQSGELSKGNGYRATYSLPNVGFQKKVLPWGCDSPPDSLVEMVDPGGGLSTDFPCFTFKSLPVLLSQYGVSWRFYGAPGDHGFAHNALDALSSVRNDPTEWANVRPFAQFTQDVAAGALPAVSWIASSENEHPPRTACAGENETVKLVNAIMQSPYWDSTAIFVFWDEWGGFYDHVPPPQVSSVSYGFRVPLLVISPYTKTGGSPDGGYVSHSFYSFPSLLKFAETNWNLPSLGTNDAQANDMTDLFDFSAPERPKLVLSTHACPTLTAAEEQYLARRSDD